MRFVSFPTIMDSCFFQWQRALTSFIDSLSVRYMLCHCILKRLKFNTWKRGQLDTQDISVNCVIHVELGCEQAPAVRAKKELAERGNCFAL